MKIVATRRCVFASAMCMGSVALPVAVAQRAPVVQGLDLQVPWQPSPAGAGQTWQLAYELHLTNFANQPLRLQRLAVIAADTGKTLAEYGGDSLRALLGRADLAPGQSDALTIPPGVRAVAYINLPFVQRPGAAIRLTHRMDAEETTGDRRDIKIEGGAMVLASWRAPIVLSAPLREGRWVAVYDAAWPRGHRRALYAVNGAVHIPGRFAVDWVKVDAEGHYTKGDPTDPDHWLGYGEEVLAGADATVAAAMDGMPEPAKVDPGKPTRVPLQDASGNYVSLDLGDGRYAFYEHLKTGSITVKAGQKVRRGEVIGRLGYTGETTGPHLHMHVADRNAPLDAEGLPFVLNTYTWLGSYQSANDFAQQKLWLPSASLVVVKEELPGPLSVVTFGSPYLFFKRSADHVDPLWKHMDGAPLKPISETRPSAR